MKTQEKVIVRFPPSPTGLVHMGSVRTALYNYIFAKQNNGHFLLRMEDTDKERSKSEYEEDIYDSLKWLGFTHDGPILKQSERTEIYKNKIQELISLGSAYISHETEGENREVVRFRNPGGKIKFTDLIRGEVEIDVSDLKDFIIAKNINEPVYHLAVVIDDLECGVTHIIRGEDHISNTPRQILILEALGGKRPIYAHLPLVLAEDKTKLSKRKHGAMVSLRYYRDLGYERDAILNFVAMIGWNPGTDQEVFSLEELIQTFDLSKVQKKGGVFNVEKLNWLNREHILKQNTDTQISNFKNQIAKTKWAGHKKLTDQNFFESFFKLVLDRIHRWGEVSELLEAGEYDYLFESPILDIEKICWKGQSKDSAKNNLQNILQIIESTCLPTRQGIMNYELCKKEIMELADKDGKGEILWPLRYALSGREKSPDPISLIKILGPEEVTNRVLKAIEKLSN